VTHSEDRYDHLLNRLRPQLDRALEHGELPAELLPENQGPLEDDLTDLEELVVAGDVAGIRARAFAAAQSFALGLNRGDEEASDPDLDAAREQLRRRRAEEDEGQEDEGDAPPPNTNAE